jgi:prepilin-type N-terminal cleavage/methylation domain-containing protein
MLDVLSWPSGWEQELFVDLKSKRVRGITLIEVLVVLLIMSVLVAIAIPFYFKSLDDSENRACQTNMDSIATAEQAQRTRTGGAYYAGPVDAAAADTNGPLRDLHNSVPYCPGAPSEGYTILTDNAGGFIVRCTNPKHHFQWHNGKWETF